MSEIPEPIPFSELQEVKKKKEINIIANNFNITVFIVSS